MKFCALILLAALAVPAAAKPVHIALKPAASVSPDAGGFFTLGSVADVTGGETAVRSRLAAVLVGRAPLSGETRHLTRDDLALKLRQAGCDPDKAVVLEGAEAADVTVTDSPPEPVGSPLAAPSPSSSVGSLAGQGGVRGQEGAASSAPTAVNISPVVHRGDAVTIVIKTGPLTITAPGIARENGAVGAAIHVHREGVMTDLTVDIVDARTVQLEI
ncbi:MAG: flagella basal body P-ring formation protein FlgA [Armatimonadota bacterium]|nr:flagella basal body P-ring formation protein FlgA [Armatimonadota bacterium]